MNLIEVLRQVKPGDSIYRRSGGKTYIYYSENCTLQWLRRQAMPRDVTANDWVIEGQISTNTLEAAVTVAAEPLRLEATAIVDVLRQHFDIPERRDALVREMWLAMQLLASPENCADFIRRSMVVS